MVNLISFLCAAVPAFVLSVLGVPLVIVVLVMIVSGATGLAVATRIDRRQETDWVQVAAVTLSDWAHRNEGHCETDPEALPVDGWELPATPWFHGVVLAVGRRSGFEVGVTCFQEASSEGAPARHTGYLVRLPEDVADLHLNRGRLRRVRRGSRLEGAPEPVHEPLAAVPPDTDSLDVADRVLYLVRPGWPEFTSLDDHVDAAVAVAAALGEQG
ncbi:hypothetical protein [Actinophytocola sp.]|uniref:hypothetical protein n=1 Tax=Actinophytocola sp. TaxID=1872138 RepID=UPI003D6A4FEB